MYRKLSTLACLLLILNVTVNAHTVITYPGWRGNNLITNSTFPYGMQWTYPCGGINPQPNNFTTWPLQGGAIAIQPGWFTGHARSLLYINIGFGTLGPYGGPWNLSLPLWRPVQINAVTNMPYPGSVCLPFVPIPESWGVKVGDRATIQVVEASVHGGAQYNCVDIAFALPEDVPKVKGTTCFNSSDVTLTEPFVDVTSIAGQILAAGVPVGESGTPTSTVPAAAGATGTGNSTCSVCPVQSQCPKSNEVGRIGEMSSGLGVGVGFGVGAVVGGLLGL